LTLPRLTIRAIRSTPVSVPLNFVLGTSAAAVREAPLLLVDLETNEGITGRAYQFCYRAAAAPAVAGFLDDILDAVKGQPVAPITAGGCRVLSSLDGRADRDSDAPGCGSAADANADGARQRTDVDEHRVDTCLGRHWRGSLSTGANAT